ncbi:hypothetical protein PQE68_gp023 [Bacillus phage vB_BanS_Sophrita]|uniref:Uncharacterized protein n=1 Tax=Bacillus phage vB_BanS_Sophrita TaxID=2894790 RepID=A0AAE8YX21_9CAUD|nr:hypothetical protein PQE68_gp023 [Bacillus phage vB_BanS_Sophrita]UGO50614.1 hypothetical protein SOPHRITA_23 [Bacillus phage vB_BanS_Sophrita]
MCMHVTSPKANLEGVKALHDYLYDLKEENYEVLGIYEQIDGEINDVEEELYTAHMTADSHHQRIEEIQNDIQNILDDWDNRDKDEIYDDLKRILF